MKLFLILAALLLVASTSTAQNVGDTPSSKSTSRWKTSPEDVFYKDAFREGLVGSRPETLGVAKTSNEGTPSGAPKSADATSGTAWSELVSARTLEDEVKALHLALKKSVTTPGRFSSGGYRDVRRQFSELATLFAVIGEYDGDVRWQAQASVPRDRFARAAANAKVTSIQAYNEAKQRKADLEELVRGGSLPSTKSAADGATQRHDWSTFGDRGPLMQRLEISFEGGLLGWTSNPKNVAAKKSAIQREAELLRMFARVLVQDGMEEADDESYVAYCRQLERAASDLLQAIRNEDVAAVRKAASDVGQSCVACHDDYRG